jgi:anthranilate phosphoribosyltransferase
VAIVWSDLLTRLVRGESLSHGEAYEALSEVLRGEVPDVAIASMLTALSAKGERVEELSGFVDAMMDAATTFKVNDDALDIVGTGGDRLHTVNVSTLAALSVAASGVPVAKHGSRAASSSVGSADVLEGLGVRLEIDPFTVAKSVEIAGMGFCFAPAFHPGLRYLVPIRRALGFPTAFNVLGPLANPARVRRLVLGVANESMVPWMAEILQHRGIERAFIVHADDGLDELSLGLPSTITEVTAAKITSWRFEPSRDFHVQHEVGVIRGGNLTTNVQLANDYLDGATGPVFDTVVANAGLALLLAERVASVREGAELAGAAVAEGRARDVLSSMVTISNEKKSSS